MAIGMPKAEAVAAILPGSARDLADTYLEWLAKAGALRINGERLNLPGRGSGLDHTETKLADRIVSAFEREGLTPRSPKELAAAIDAKQQVFDGLVRHLTQSGRLVRLKNGLFLSRGAIDGLARDLAETGWPQFTVGDFKERFGLSRKWAIPLLEHLDAQKVTQRSGDHRRLLQRSPPPDPTGGG